MFNEGKKKSGIGVAVSKSQGKRKGKKGMRPLARFLYDPKLSPWRASCIMYDSQPIVCLRYSETPLQYVVGKFREKRKEREKEKREIVVNRVELEKERKETRKARR